MKRLLILLVLFNSLLLAATTDNNDSAEKKRLEKQIKIEIEREKKFAREQIFYSEKYYDFKGSLVNPETVKKVKEPENLDYFDMDSVYD